MTYKCPKCGENENLHFNLDYTKQNRPVLNVLCNECGEFFGEKPKSNSVRDDLRSKHWADVLNWLQTVVDSCKTKEQAGSCYYLIKNFHRLYEQRLGLREVWDLTREMERKLWDVGDLTFSEKIKKIHSI